jgi:hypothetical protein
MHSLLSDRFLKRFAAKRKGRQRQPSTRLEEQKTDPEKIDGSDSQETEVVGGKGGENIEKTNSPDITNQQADVNPPDKSLDSRTQGDKR